MTTTIMLQIAGQEPGLTRRASLFRTKTVVELGFGVALVVDPAGVATSNISHPSLQHKNLLLTSF
jgi:hypothetical protein